MRELGNKSRSASDDKIRNEHAFYHGNSSTFLFDVKVVVTYRHYFNWLPSNYYNQEIHSKVVPPSLAEPPSLIHYVKKELWSLGEDYHSDGKLDFTNTTFLENYSLMLNRNHGTLYAYLRWSQPRSLHDRVEVFDMHQQQIIPSDVNVNVTSTDILHDFVCQALPDAANTCLELMNVKKKLQNE